MRARLVPIFALIMALMITRSEAGEPEREPLPQPAPGWSIELAARAPRICNPTSIVVAADGTIYLGQAPMEKSGPAGVRSGSVLAIKDGKSCVFAGGLGTVSGLEWIDGTLYVDHPPELSSFRDTDRDGRADDGCRIANLGCPGRQLDRPTGRRLRQGFPLRLPGLTPSD